MRTRDQIKFVFCGALFFIVSCSTFTKQITNKTGEIMQNSIASLESYKIGGVQQWVLMRSENINNPILIYLHGGPGSPVIPVVNKYNSELEKKFILVQWEQRGAGKSHKNSIPPETMTIDQFIIDLDELVSLLKKKFGKQKVFLIGHSWGSALGLLYTNKFPENVYAYIGTGQTVKVADGELISYKYTLKKAYESGNKQAITVRERIELKCVLQRGVRAWACSFLFIVNCIRKSTRF